MRLPLKRKRENAYAASAPRSTVVTAVAVAMIIVFRYQLGYGSRSFVRIARKLSSVTPSGTTVAVESDGIGLKAAETT